MAEDQQRALLLIAGLAGAVLLLARPSSGTAAQAPIPTIWPATVNGARPLPTVPYYQNDERWELRRDADGRLSEIVIHRDARVAR